MFELLQTSIAEEAGERVHLGIHHEQQHQELLLTDIKHILCTNPLHPVYRKKIGGTPQAISPLEYLSFPEGFSTLGFNGSGFSFDNEHPHHRLWLNKFQLCHRLITNGEYLDFINDGAYQNPLLWLSDGWDWIQNHQAKSPLYWENNDGNWYEISLSGKNPLELNLPVMHLNYYEAEAYARWSGARLPTEAEWERAAMDLPVKGNFYHPDLLHPQPAVTSSKTALNQMFGDLWEWTASPYTPYPGFKPAAGAVGEYNGKFMVNQVVLRGGSCFTPDRHIRKTYRNFFPPGAQWQATGLRLAKDGRP